MDYITLDFETASSSLTSPCSIGIVRVLNDKIYDEIFSLINPEEPFNDYNITVHNISKEDVSDALTVKQIWPKLYEILNNQVVVCHNASFDISVIKACAQKHHLPMPNIKVVCTLKIAKKLWTTELNNHRLNTIADYLEVELDHHNALSDARVCYYIVNRGMRLRQVDSVEELYDALGLQLRKGY